VTVTVAGVGKRVAGTSDRASVSTRSSVSGRKCVGVSGVRDCVVSGQSSLISRRTKCQLCGKLCTSKLAFLIYHNHVYSQQQSFSEHQQCNVFFSYY